MPTTVCISTQSCVESANEIVAETMSRKFFVSVPLIMSWMFTAMKVLLSKETTKKFVVMSYATSLAGDLGPNVPETYGGKGEPLDKVGQTIKVE